MKSNEVAHKYGLAEFTVTKFIKENADFPIKENWWGDIIIPDGVDVEELIRPLLAEKEKAEKDLIEWRQAKEQKKQEERDRQEKLRQEKEDAERKKIEEQYHLRIDKLKEKNVEGYYEYKVISLSDTSGLFKKNSGRVDIEVMTQTLNDLGLDGWHLVTAYSNELGKNALSGGVGGALMGVNSTVDENILIFERFIKI
jgi:hypothetical protein